MARNRKMKDGNERNNVRVKRNSTDAYSKVRREQKSSTAQHQDEIDRYILVRKTDRTTY